MRLFKATQKYDTKIMRKQGQPLFHMLDRRIQETVIMFTTIAMNEICNTYIMAKAAWGKVKEPS